MTDRTDTLPPPDATGVSICDHIDGSPIGSADVYTAATVRRLLAERDERIRVLEAALRMLMKEVDDSGNGTARDFGWPAACAAARTALEARNG